ncbi:Adenylyl cyclase-associated protein [Ceratocystis fimbriata CBS 114723]|uniref:Adenylyl cyclase-associated protein n=2 Tax=Ceratocystis TaxID=5157 RepID=A0A0F8DJM5_CERFI|nr:Adenylyl cyclase-associated protein [Ceratocystis platani]PHH52624.1 Adenylyl cyclase-associated protein [Ceratocystis fimbriata CBS 114723]
MASSGPMHNLTTLIKRLEAATMRLEDIAEATIAISPPAPEVESFPSETLNSVDNSVTPRASATATASAPALAVSSPAPAAPAKQHEEPLPDSIVEFDNFLSNSIGNYVELSNKLGGLVAEQAAKVLEGFQEQRKFLLLSTMAQKPDIHGSEMALYQDLIKPINDALMSVINYKDNNRGSPMFSQLSTVSEGIMLLAWVTVENRPWKHVEESLGPSQFFGNRVLKEFREKDPQQVEWVNSFYQVFRDLIEYVKEHFPHGLIWNPKGKPAAEVALELSAKSAPPAPAAPAGSGPPPPPPPPPPGPPPILDFKTGQGPTSSSTEGGGFGAVFSELNRGSDVTKGLKKVDKSQMTHKNPTLRGSSVVSETSSRGKSPAPGKKPKPESMRMKKPPRKELEGNKWTIENFEKEPQPVIIEGSISHSILISKCNHTTIIIKGKVNAITIETTNRLSLVVDDLISTVDAVKSSNFALQVMGAVPAVMLDQIDGSEIYFSKQSSDTRVFTSKSANVSINVIGDDDDYKELPLPSQICSYYDKEKDAIVNEIVKHDG